MNFGHFSIGSGVPFRFPEGSFVLLKFSSYSGFESFPIARLLDRCSEVYGKLKEIVCCSH